MAKGGIEWNYKLEKELKEAIGKFNRKVNRIEREGRGFNTPLNYNEEKEKIKTRKGLNQFIKRINRFQKEGAEKIIMLDNGELITNWEYETINIERTNLRRTLTRQLNKIDKTLFPYPTTVEMDIEGTFKFLNNLENKIGNKFWEGVERLFNETDYNTKYVRAERFKKNYMKVMEKYSNYQNYDILLKKMESISNPLNFIKFISSNDIIADLQFQSDTTMSQARFNEFVKMWGLEIDNDVEIINIEGQDINVKNFNKGQKAIRTRIKNKKNKGG